MLRNRRGERLGRPAAPFHLDREEVRAPTDRPRAPGGVRGLARHFRIVDRNGNGALDPSEFFKVCALNRLPLSDDDVRLLFAHFDSDRSGEVAYDEFLRAVRGDREKALERWRETEAWRREHPWRATLSRPALIICWSFALPEKSPENVAAVRPSLNWSSTRRRASSVLIVIGTFTRSPTALARKSALTNM